MTAESKIQSVNGRRCWGVRLVCGIQLNVNSRRHECEQAGRCIFAPTEPKPETAHGVTAAPAPEPCEFPACAVHHICDRNCTRNAGVLETRSTCNDCGAIEPQKHAPDCPKVEMERTRGVKEDGRG